MLIVEQPGRARRKPAAMGTSLIQEDPAGGSECLFLRVFYTPDPVWGRAGM